MASVLISAYSRLRITDISTVDGEGAIALNVSLMSRESEIVSRSTIQLNIDISRDKLLGGRGVVCFYSRINLAPFATVYPYGRGNSFIARILNFTALVMSADISAASKDLIIVRSPSRTISTVPLTVSIMPAP